MSRVPGADILENQPALEALTKRLSSTRGIVQAFCNLTSHKLQQKQFHLFHTPDSILYDIKKVLGKYPGGKSRNR